MLTDRWKPNGGAELILEAIETAIPRILTCFSGCADLNSCRANMVNNWLCKSYPMGKAVQTKASAVGF